MQHKTNRLISRNNKPTKSKRYYSSKDLRKNNRNNYQSRRSFNTKRAQPSFDPSQFINKNPIEITPEKYTPIHTSFSDFSLHTQITENVKAHNLLSPSPIQDKIIPEIVKGKDVIGLAQTGTGKTAAFLLPLLDRAIKNKTRTILILTPTRELAIQVEQELRKFAQGTRQTSSICVGGIPIGPQIRSLRNRPRFIIGTPGRVMDLIDRGNIKIKQIGTVVLDEADRMLDMGFINDMQSILSATPTDRHTLFFSATMTKEAEKITNNFLYEPITVSVKKQDVTNSIAQDVIPYFPESKLDTLLTLLGTPSCERVIIFGGMKRSVENLCIKLRQAGVSAESIHGNKTHSQRQKALSTFKNGQAKVLVATDVAARGIHVDDVSHVINYDLPNTFEDYVHRIGRTGRGTKSGQALTLIPRSSAKKS